MCLPQDQHVLNILYNIILSEPSMLFHVIRDCVTPGHIV